MGETPMLRYERGGPSALSGGGRDHVCDRAGGIYGPQKPDHYLFVYGADVSGSGHQSDRVWKILGKSGGPGVCDFCIGDRGGGGEAGSRIGSAAVPAARYVGCGCLERIEGLEVDARFV